MELLLNLVWLLLAVPSYLLWRECARARLKCRASSLQCLLVLGCALVLLFPVISASDDLHVMRAEIEESATSKRTVRQAASDRSASWTNWLQGAPAMASSATWLPVPEVERLEISVRPLSTLARRYAPHAGRAPPFSLLG
jgi:hypothetical protein